MSDPVINSVSSTEILATEMSRLTTSATECKSSGQLVIQRSGSSNESPSLSRDVSTELYTDFCGVDSQQFLMDTLKSSVKNREFLIKIEKDVLTFIRDDSRISHKFPGMNTFNRMLVHRVAAFFGLDHSVEKRSPDCVTVTKCEKTRIPDIKFEDVPISPEALSQASAAATAANDNHVVVEPTPKQVLKRSDGKGASFEKSPDRRNNSRNDNGMKKSGSYEERQVRYQHARDRIFASQASSSSDGGGDVSSGVSCNMDTTANSSLKSSQDNVSSKATLWSSGSFESGTASTSRRLKRQNRVTSSLDSENMTTSNNFLTPDYNSFSHSDAMGSGKKLGVVPKASSFGGATECSAKGIDLKETDLRLPRNNSFNITTTDSGSGDCVKRPHESSSNHQSDKVNHSSDLHQEASSERSQSSNKNDAISSSESNTQPGPGDTVTTSPPTEAYNESGTGILPKPPLIHQSSAPDGRNPSHQHANHHRQNSWQTSHQHSFNYHQSSYQNQQAPGNRNWQRDQQPSHHYQSGHYSGPRHRYPRGMNYNSSAHSSSAPHHHFVTMGPTLPAPPPGPIPTANPAAGAYWPHPELRPHNPIHVIMNPKDVQIAQQQQMMIQGMNLITNPEQMWMRNKQIQSAMFMGQEAAASAQMMPNHYMTQIRVNSNGNPHQSSGHRVQNDGSSGPSHYANQSRGRQNHHQNQQQPAATMTLSAAPGLYYVNPHVQSSQSVAQAPFMMLTPRLPLNATFASSQYANPQSPHQQQQQQQDASAIPVSMPISYTSIPTGGAGVQPIAYLVSGMPSAAGGTGLLPVPYATAAYAPPPGSLTMPANPFPYPVVSYDPSCLTSYPDFRLFTSPPPTQAMNHSASGGAASYVKHSPPPAASQQPPTPQQQQQSTPDTTPPLGPGPTVNPQYFSGYTICAPSTLPPVMPQMGLNQFCQMAGGMNPNPTHYPTHHQYHQPRSRNPNHSGPKNHFRS